MDYSDWEKNVYQTYYAKKTNTQRFYGEYNKRVRLRQRAPLPPGSMAVPVKFGQKTVTSELLLEDKNVPLGSVCYYVGNVNSLHNPKLAETAPYLFVPLNNPPRLLVILGFYSYREHQTKGIGSAMLRELLKIADEAECFYVVVAGGVNHPVYEALDFDLVDRVLETWCISLSRLHARLSPLRRFREAP